jgi:hypothetical protein
MSAHVELLNAGAGTFRNERASSAHRIQQEIEENQLQRARVSTSDHTHCPAAMTRVPVDSFPVNQVQRSLR